MRQQKPNKITTNKELLQDILARVEALEIGQKAKPKDMPNNRAKSYLDSRPNI